MPYREVHFRWEYDLKSSPEQLWPFVSDTNRFNRDTGVPSIEPTRSKSKRLRNARQRLRLSFYGFALEWEEQPFEWIRPLRFGVARKYSKGPIAELRALAELTALASGSRLRYEIWLKPKSLLGAILMPLQLRFLSSARFAKAFKKYDQIASTTASVPTVESMAELPQSALRRIKSAKERLLAEEVKPAVVEQLVNRVERANDFAVSRIRPYELADSWKEPRREVLTACLRATRAGLLDLRWDLLCPLCRGAKESESSMRDISSKVHCETCGIDFNANFDRFVEVTFRPNSSVRNIENKDFCMGSPQKTPHIVAQQLLAAGSSRVLSLPLEQGHYRLRALELPGEQRLTITEAGHESGRIELSQADWSQSELNLATHSSLELNNITEAEQLVILERLAWNDQAATAAEVTALQVFRDLFSSEALRPGEQISVGTLTVLFTDLRNSTRLYREIGDATAFGRVMNHFDVLKKEIADESGALVKTIGDAVMAVFSSPAGALRAMLKAQRVLGAPADGSMPLTLKAGIHTGPCIAVTLNDRLDYFGSTVNMAARLESLSSGNDVIISSAAYDDPEVRELVASENNIHAEPFEIELKGFAQERFHLWRVERTESASRTEALGRAS